MRLGFRQPAGPCVEVRDHEAPSSGVGFFGKAPVRLVGHPKRASDERISLCQLRVEDSPRIRRMLKQSARESFCFILNPES